MKVKCAAGESRFKDQNKSVQNDSKSKMSFLRRYYFVSAGVLVVAIIIGSFFFANGSIRLSYPKPTNGASTAWGPHCQSSTKEWLHPLVDLNKSTKPDFQNPVSRQLLWGTYRPSVYFGWKSRTAPETLVGGLLWHGQGKSIDEARHDCLESDKLSKYGWSRHDGIAYGEQKLHDPLHGVKLTTWFVKPEYLVWYKNTQESPLAATSESVMVAARVQAVNSSQSHFTLQKVGLFWYFGVDFDGNEQPASGSDFGLSLLDHNASSLTVSVWTEKLGEMEFTLRVVNFTQEINMSFWGGRGIMFADIHQHLKDQCASAAGEGCQLPNAVQIESNVIAISIQGPMPLAFDVVLTRTSPHLSSSPSLETEITRWLEAGSKAFDRRFEEVYMLKEKGFNQKDTDAAKAALSNMIGGIGYFHGQYLVRAQNTDSSINVPSFHASLFTAVPSRSFFPRGFLWDEGFHQLLITTWNKNITLDVLSHWMDTMHVHQSSSSPTKPCFGAWIPREQILGETARRRVPAEFIPQDINVANPPSLFLAVQKLLVQFQGTCNSTGQCGTGSSSNRPLSEFLASIAPKLHLWTQWFFNSQRPAATVGTDLLFQWQGRNINEAKLVPNTLASGLDDYPRSMPPHAKESHVDLLSWMILCCQVMGQLQNLTFLENGAFPYRETEIQLRHNLLLHHWNEEEGGFFDLGLYGQEEMVVRTRLIRCYNSLKQPRDFEVLEETLVSNPTVSPCPEQFPNFAYVLSDSKMRYLARDSEFGHVLRTGYTTLFPFILKLLDPASNQVGRLLEMIRNETTLWSPFGIRSLSKADFFYNRENAPGDAPYWRGFIWINMNYLILSSLKYYSTTEGPHRLGCETIYRELRQNLMGSVLKEYRRTGYFWEQYSDETGHGRRSHPFTGWTALIVNIMAEMY